MSIEFSLVSKRKVPLEELLARTGLVLQQILNLPAPSELQVKESKGSRHLIGEAGDTCTLAIDDHGEANLMFLDLPYDDTSPDLMLRTAVISAGEFRTDLSLAIAAALAIALGSMTRANITDDALLLSEHAHINPDLLLEKIRLREAHDNPLSAAHDFVVERKLV